MHADRPARRGRGEGGAADRAGRDQVRRPVQRAQQGLRVRRRPDGARPPATPARTCSTRTPGWPRCCARPRPTGSGRQDKISVLDEPRRTDARPAAVPASARSSTRSPTPCSRTGSAPTSTTCPARCRCSTSSARCSSPRARPRLPARAVPGDQAGARHRPRPARHRGPRPDVAPLHRHPAAHRSPSPGRQAQPAVRTQRVGVALAIGGQPGGTDDAGGVQQLGRARSRRSA